MTVKKNEAEAALDNLKAQSASSIATLQNKLDGKICSTITVRIRADAAQTL